MMTGRVLEEIPIAECRDLLARHTVGRSTVTLPGDGPLVVPVNYTSSDNAILFRSGWGAKLRALSARPVILEIDGHDAAGRTGWSVLARGRAREIHTRDAHPPLPPLARRRTALPRPDRHHRPHRPPHPPHPLNLTPPLGVRLAGED
jgi:nitroimidazol reductase NimA-like FMN-containing flavoprotein (pyridoxamine 5'-phosphate oxidase superfamily)